MLRSVPEEVDVDEVSRKWGARCRTEFLKLRDRELAGVRAETRTKNEAIAKLQRACSNLCTTYLRWAGTTYQGWLDHGPRRDLEEVLAAAKDDAVWDRLVETFDTRRTD